MKLEEFLARLSRGELSNLSIGSDGAGSIEESSIPKVIGYINEALTRLHSRFFLRENSLFIIQSMHVTNYRLRYKYAQSNKGSAEQHRYIVDRADEPFEDDVIKILTVTDNLGHRYPLNDQEAWDSLFTPQPDVLQIPNPKSGLALAITYQAKHKILTADKLSEEIDLPVWLESALTNYVAYQTFSHMNGQEQIAKGQEHLQAYEMLCLEIEKQDLTNQTISNTDTKFEKRGFI